MIEVTEDIIHLVVDYFNYDFSEVELWSDENIINAYKDILKEIENYYEE